MIEAYEKDGLLTVTLNRPDKANSLTGDMLSELADLFENADPLALVLTGAGEKVFSAGADLEEARAGLATSPLWERVSGALAALTCPTIAALNGTLAGGAFGMALACDIRLCVPGASFFYPVAKLGFLPQPSDPGRLAALVGPSRAKLLLMAGAKLTTEEALAFGLVDRVVARADLMAYAEALCAPALTGDTANVRTIKAMVG
ncbi:enoyl-CoA hydratase/isomerase family protein [Gymnodinialimonas hymeniacidonis]|uniref:enoyl-CoA hydratase/isomerase family protein n=1 Tax=Gymnodinialimonas hymeniacidonis TaxID=3126508 RepID=UPI0034C62B94